MKIYIRSASIFGMANLPPKRTGLPCDIWSDHKGILRQVSHSNTARAKISVADGEALVSIEAEPKFIEMSKRLKNSDIKSTKEGIEYIGRNFDLFLKHYNDKDDSFDDLDFFQALKDRGEYK